MSGNNFLNKQLILFVFRVFPCLADSNFAYQKSLQISPRVALYFYQETLLLFSIVDLKNIVAVGHFFAIKMVEIGVSIVAKVAEYLITPIGRKFSYLCNCNDNLENLRKEVEKLIDARARVEHSVADAKRKGEEIEQDVEEWCEQDHR